MHKYNINDIVWTIYDNAVKKCRVLSPIKISITNDGVDILYSVQILTDTNAITGIGTSRTEEKLFPTKEELLNSL